MVGLLLITCNFTLMCKIKLLEDSYVMGGSRESGQEGSVHGPTLELLKGWSTSMSLLLDLKPQRLA